LSKIIKIKITMKKIYLYLSLLLAILLVPVLSQAQFIKYYKEKGDQYFNKENYYGAAVLYQKALNLLPDDVYYLPYLVRSPRNGKEKEDAKAYQYLVYRLGESFRFYKDYERAGKWYKKTMEFKTDNFPLAGLWYAVCLRAEGNYQQAGKVLKSFVSAYSGEEKYIDRAHLEMASCQFALEQLKYPRLAEVKELPQPVNAEKGSEYAPVLQDDTLYFSSSRALKSVKSKKHSPYINKIYRTKLNQEASAHPEKVNLSDNKLINEAAASFNKEQQLLYFTKVQPSEKKDHAGRYVIMVSKRNADGTYQEPKILGAPVNIEGTDTKEASVTADGKYLIFSSNRAGGLGGVDLWYCALNRDGLPTGNAIHLEQDINTERDELNPFYDTKTGYLYYSSNGKVGMGGLDLYRSEGNFAGNEGWSMPQNLGYPLNSSKDDVYYYPKENRKGFFTSSDRNSVCCLNLYNVELKKIRLIGHVYDKNTGEPIDEVNSSLTDSITEASIGELTTTDDGFFHFALSNRRPLKMHFSHKQYGTENVIITHRQLTKVDSVFEQDIYLTLLYKPIRIQNIYYNFDKANIRPESKYALDSLLSLLREHPEWKVEIGAHTDALGSDQYNEWLSQQRAESVVTFLVNQGISKNRLEAKGYGESRSIAPNKNPDGSDNPEGRQLNRRTEFTILGIIHQDGKVLKELNSVMGDKDKIEVDKSRAYHLSRSKKWIREK